MFIHVGGRSDSIFLSEIDEFGYFCSITDIDFSEVFDVRADFIFPDFEIAFSYVKKVTNFLHVELKNGDFQLELD